MEWFVFFCASFIIYFLYNWINISFLNISHHQFRYPQTEDLKKEVVDKAQDTRKSKETLKNHAGFLDAFYHPIRKKQIIWLDEFNHKDQITDFDAYEIIDPKQIFYPLDQIPVFEGIRLPILPIRVEYADLVDFKRLADLTLKTEVIKIDRSLQYKIYIPLVGKNHIFEVMYQSMSNLKNVDVFLDVWPNLPDWKTYWITSRFYRLKNNEVSGLNRDWQIDYFAFDSKNPLLINKIAEKPWQIYKDIPEATVSIPIDAWPELIHLYHHDRRSGCLIYNAKPMNTYLNDKDGVIGMDFGTKHTVICIADDGDVLTHGSFEAYVQEAYKTYSYRQPFHSETHFNPFKHRAKRIIENTHKVTNDMKTGDFYAPITSHKQFNPSQNPNQPKILIVETGLKYLNEAKDQNHIPRAPFNHFTLAIIDEGDPITEEGIAIYSSTKPVDKWQTSPSLDTQNFFKELLCVSLAEYWSLYPQSNANLICATPLAFSVANHKTFHENLTTAKKWLENEVLPGGLSFIWSGKTYPESVATYTASALVPIGTKDSLTVVADLGADTLEIGILHEKIRSIEKKILLSDSVRLGDSMMFKYLKKLCGEDTKSILDGDLYRFSYRNIQKARDIPNGIWEDFQETVQKWLILNMAYLARSILGAHYELKGNQKVNYDLGTINVLLAGSGWKTCEALNYTPDILEKILQKVLNDQIKKLDEQFKVIAYVFSLHRCGLEKIAIAGGLHKIRSIANIPVGLKASNGIDEISSDDQEIKWSAFVEETEPWSGVALKLTDKLDSPSFSPAIANISSEYQIFSRQQLMMINHCITASQTPNGGRKKTMASVVFEQVLENIISSPH